ncbi:hypothetical protein [Sphingopyxis sp.]|uniref:hypothetical protein n=1 Tax=Sphingopyxis sp. TaxID=1908224 RepID=UPI003BAAC94E
MNTLWTPAFAGEHIKIVRNGSFALRHAELVSASMARPLLSRRAQGNGSPWILKQVQDDEAINVAFWSKAGIAPFVIPAKA